MHKLRLVSFSRKLWAQERCRISPPRFLAECCKRRLNQASSVLFCFLLFAIYGLSLVFVLCVFLICLFPSCTDVNGTEQSDFAVKNLITHSLRQCPSSLNLGYTRNTLHACQNLPPSVGSCANPATDCVIRDHDDVADVGNQADTGPVAGSAGLAADLTADWSQRYR